MNKVNILPPEIVSKIAAGEVIERPASVIKELIENALDAKTSRIELHLKQAGKSSIRIKDSGFGIAREDIDKIFKRHSTSKISSVDDLYSIQSLGFRGEALYSIAAVSDVVLKSKTEGSAEGWEIHVRGGKQLNLKPASIPAGTEVVVKELFFNTPARRKFLKSNISEMNQVLSLITPYTLLYPQCRFLLTHESKTVIDLPPTNTMTERIAAALNLDEQHFMEAKQIFEEKNIHVRMILGDINIVRSRRDMQFIFVNGRPVECKNISFHMNDVYRLILPPRNFSFFCLFLDVPAENIDANIHPTKREVKIKDEKELNTLLRRMCENILMSQGSAKQAGAALKESVADEKSKDALRQARSSTKAFDQFFDEALPREILERDNAGTVKQTPTEQHSFPDGKQFSSAGDLFYPPKKESLVRRLEHARYVGAFISKFLLFEVDNSLLVVDQHAAQERITFEHLIEQMDNSRVEVQHLLSPYLLKLTAQEFLIWDEAKDMLDSIGFSSTQFDNETIALQTYPVLIKQPDKAYRDILAGDNAARCDHEQIARRACRSSIMAGDKLNREQAEFQREQLLKCKDPFTCPHGRPTVIELSEIFLDKQFLRT